MKLLLTVFTFLAALPQAALAHVRYITDEECEYADGRRDTHGTNRKLLTVEESKQMDDASQDEDESGKANKTLLVFLFVPVFMHRCIVVGCYGW